jgi:hypothetical protein
MLLLSEQLPLPPPQAARASSDQHDTAAAGLGLSAGGSITGVKAAEPRGSVDGRGGQGSEL